MSDHLNTETSLSVELKETGLTASAKSRTVAALDRLGGSAFDWINLGIESRNSKRRATMEGERRLIEAAVKYGVERIGKDQAFAERAFGNHFAKVARAQVNKDSVLAEALTDLRDNPATEAESLAGPETLSEEFLDRFEHYAEAASSEELRERWGRILAAEVRKPGTFSSKVLRVVDEMEASTAALFEQVCASRLGTALPKCLVGDLSFEQSAELIAADLVHEPGLGQYRGAADVKDKLGTDLKFVNLTEFGVGFKIENIKLGATVGETSPLVDMGTGLGVPCYVLTDVGFAISTILPNQASAAFSSFVKKLSAIIPLPEIRVYRSSSKNGFAQVGTGADIV